MSRHSRGLNTIMMIITNCTVSEVNIENEGCSGGCITLQYRDKIGEGTLMVSWSPEIPDHDPFSYPPTTGDELSNFFYL
jgi:hypothetical protein